MDRATEWAIAIDEMLALNRALRCCGRTTSRHHENCKTNGLESSVSATVCSMRF